MTANVASLNLLQGDTALVTGAASGIGRAIALAVAREGARIILTDSNEAGGRDAESECRAGQADAHFVAADLSSPDGVKSLLSRAHELLGAISVFVHSASPRRQEFQSVLAVTEQEWDLMLNVNLKSGFLLGQELGRRMRDGGIRGRMVFITSLHADSPRTLPHYSAAKAGETMVMKELARALGPHGIRVNAIAPGAVAGGGFAANVAALTPKIALRRVGTPSDIAPAVIALLSDRFSGYVTGTTLVVDGGIALHNWIDG